MSKPRAAALAAVFLLLCAGFSNGFPRSSTALGAEDCRSLKSKVASQTELYLEQKATYDTTVRAIRVIQARLEIIRRLQSREFLETGKTSPAYDGSLQINMEKLKYYDGIRTTQLKTAKETYRQLQVAKAALKVCPSRPATPAPSTTEEWAGTYVNTSGSYKLEIAGSGATFTAETTWTGTGNQGGANTLNCTAHGSTATCEGTGSYFDDDKTITTTMETTLRKSGSTIRETDKILTASCAPKKVADCKDLGYTPAVRAGAEFTNNVRKP